MLTLTRMLLLTLLLTQTLAQALTLTLTLILTLILALTPVAVPRLLGWGVPPDKERAGLGLVLGLGFWSSERVKVRVDRIGTSLLHMSSSTTPLVLTISGSIAINMIATVSGSVTITTMNSLDLAHALHRGPDYSINRDRGIQHDF